MSNNIHNKEILRKKMLPNDTISSLLKISQSKLTEDNS